MTKEKLEKEAREYLAEHSEYSEVFGQTFVAVDTLTAMVDFAEPREKKIESLGKRCLQLQKDKGELTDKIRELERRIASIRGSHRVYVKKLNARIEQVERLKKENAELKARVSEQSERISELTQELDDKINRFM